MLYPRLIPVLLVRNGGLVKTVQFADDKYVGDPINAVRIFNEKEVDEITILDIDASKQNREPNYDLVRKLAAECRMPLCYGGGVTKVDQFERLIELGAEKVAVCSAAAKNENIISQAAQRVGGQSVVAIIDYRKTGLLKKAEVVTMNGTIRTGFRPHELAQRLAAVGAGEIVLNSVDRDGTMDGYDLEMVAKVKGLITIPLTVLGGAGRLEDVSCLIKKFGIIGAAAGSMFVFKGKYRAVLIQYPTRDEKEHALKFGI